MFRAQLDEVWVHAGLTKTGSTALQQAFKRHAGALAAAGLSYPLEGDHSNQHPMIHKRWMPVRVAREARRAAQGGARAMIVSDENIFLMRPPEVSFLRALRRNAKRVRVVLYLRNPYDWLASYYVQFVLQRSHQYSRAFAAFLEEQRAHLPYSKLVARLEAEVDEVRVRRYEDARQDPRGLVGDFLNAIGAEVDMPAPARSNPSIPYSAAATLRDLNRMGGWSNEAHRGMEQAIYAADHMPRRVGFIGPEDTHAIRELFADDPWYVKPKDRKPGFQFATQKESFEDRRALLQTLAAHQDGPAAEAGARARKLLERQTR